MRAVEAFTDGACRGNPGPGGWGVVLRAGSPSVVLAQADLAAQASPGGVVAAVSFDVAEAVPQAELSIEVDRGSSIAIRDWTLVRRR